MYNHNKSYKLNLLFFVIFFYIPRLLLEIIAVLLEVIFCSLFKNIVTSENRWKVVYEYVYLLLKLY